MTTNKRGMPVAMVTLGNGRGIFVSYRPSRRWLQHCLRTSMTRANGCSEVLLTAVLSADQTRPHDRGPSSHLYGENDRAG